MTQRIYIAYTGGTFGMRRGAFGYQPDANLASRLADVLSAAGENGLPYRHMHEYARLIDSAEAQPRDWYTIAADIAARYDAFDGFVVIHGTDTLAYTAAALSFALAGLRKPVIITGAQIPLGEPGSDARDNLMGALHAAANPALPEVCVYFNGKLLRGNRVVKVSSATAGAFDSPRHPALGMGRSGGKITIAPHHVLSMPAREAFEIVAPTPRELGVLQVHPGLSVARLTRLLAPPLAGLVLQSYGAGNAPVHLPGFVDALADASARGVVIINVSQCLHGHIEAGKYASGAPLATAGVISGHDMTTAAAFTKLAHLFALGLDADEIRRRLPQPRCGECTLPGAGEA